jgi:hypothetical protein
MTERVLQRGALFSAAMLTPSIVFCIFHESFPRYPFNRASSPGVAYLRQRAGRRLGAIFVHGFLEDIAVH